MNETETFDICRCEQNKLDPSKFTDVYAVNYFAKCLKCGNVRIIEYQHMSTLEKTRNNVEYIGQIMNA